MKRKLYPCSPVLILKLGLLLTLITFTPVVLEAQKYIPKSIITITNVDEGKAYMVNDKCLKLVSSSSYSPPPVGWFLHTKGSAVIDNFVFTSNKNGPTVAYSHFKEQHTTFVRIDSVYGKRLIPPIKFEIPSGSIYWAINDLPKNLDVKLNNGHVKAFEFPSNGLSHPSNWRPFLTTEYRLGVFKSSSNNLESFSGKYEIVENPPTIVFKEYLNALLKQPVTARVPEGRWMWLMLPYIQTTTPSDTFNADGTYELLGGKYFIKVTPQQKGRNKREGKSIFFLTTTRKGRESIYLSQGWGDVVIQFSVNEAENKVNISSAESTRIHSTVSIRIPEGAWDWLLLSGLQ